VVKKFHELSIETFVQATEDESRVMEAMENLIGREIEELQVFDSEGVHRNPIKVLKTSFRREREIRGIISSWKEMEFWKEAVEKADERMDENLVFHLRVDKQAAFGNEIKLWKKGESIHIRLKVASFPASREKGLEVIRML
jgi:hypothetical protein